MEKKTIEKPVYKVTRVKTKAVEVLEVFVTEDGKEFLREKDALDHEKYCAGQKILASIRKVEFESEILREDQFWYFIETQEQLDVVYGNFVASYKHCYHFLNGDDFEKANLKVGDWVTFQYKDGGDYSDRQYAYTLEFVLGEIEQLKEKLK